MGLERAVSRPERNRPREQPRTRPNAAAVVTALHDPLTVLLAYDLADVVAPHDDSSD